MTDGVRWGLEAGYRMQDAGYRIQRGSGLRTTATPCPRCDDQILDLSSAPRSLLGLSAGTAFQHTRTSPALYPAS